MTDDTLERMRGVANFYKSSSNVSDTFAHVNGVDGEFTLDADDLLNVVAEIERLRDALKEITSMPSLKSTEEEWRRVAKSALKETK